MLNTRLVLLVLVALCTGFLPASTDAPVEIPEADLEPAVADSDGPRGVEPFHAVARTQAVDPAWATASLLPRPSHYVTTSDDISIALRVRVPGPGKWPTVIKINGYTAGTGGNTVDARPDTYATVGMSIRGTGCSSGQFDLFDLAHRQDSYEIIEWIAEQDWSDGNIGIDGHSYTGLEGFLAATTNPPHLRAAAISGLIGDTYRGVAYRGGIPNSGFPVLWTVYMRWLSNDVQGGTAPALAEGDTQCATNVAARGASDPFASQLAAFTAYRLDHDYYRVRSLLTYADEIRVPMQIGQGYQDDQTGPRGGPVLFEAISPDPIQRADGSTWVPKQLIIGNGRHNDARNGAWSIEARAQWLDHFVRGVDVGVEDQPPVRALLEATGPDVRPTSVLEAQDFPVPGTEWRNYHLRADATLTPAAPSAEEGSSTYVSGSPRRSWSVRANVPPDVAYSDGPDQLRFTTDAFDRPEVMFGPIVANLRLATTAPDTDLMVELSDIGPDGNEQSLQIGLLRASHRELDTEQSWTTDDGTLYRPWHPHDATEPVSPGEINDYSIEIPPVGHVFRPGHRLQLAVTSPAGSHGHDVYGMDQRIPAINTVHHSAAEPSSIQLPFVPAPAAMGSKPSCGQQPGVRCIPAPTVGGGPEPSSGSVAGGGVVNDNTIPFGVEVSVSDGAGRFVVRKNVVQGGYTTVIGTVQHVAVDGTVATVDAICAPVQGPHEGPCTLVVDDGGPAADEVSLTVGTETIGGPLIGDIVVAADNSSTETVPVNVR